MRTTLKPEADVHARSPDGDPILASWRHGLGRVLAVATPLQGEWADQWVETTFAGGLLRQAIRWTRAPVLKPGVNLEVRRVGDALVASARVVDDKGAAVDGARVVARADGPDGETVGPVLLANVGRGSHVGTLDAFTRDDFAFAPSVPMSPRHHPRIVKCTSRTHPVLAMARSVWCGHPSWQMPPAVAWCWIRTPRWFRTRSSSTARLGSAPGRPWRSRASSWQ